jgi:hypothetical protein
MGIGGFFMAFSEPILALTFLVIYFMYYFYSASLFLSVWRSQLPLEVLEDVGYVNRGYCGYLIIFALVQNITAYYCRRLIFLNPLCIMAFNASLWVP